MKQEIAECLIDYEIFKLYKGKDYPLNLENICRAIDRGGGQTVDISGVLEALNKAGYKIVLK